MDNPFQVLNDRLSSIENQLLSLTHALPELIAKSQQQDADQDSYINKKEAAQLWGCCTSTIDNYARRGILTRHYIGSSVRFKRSEVLEVVEQMNKRK